MTSKFTLLFIAFVFGYLSVSAQTVSPSSFPNKEKLIVRGNDNYPPFEYINSDGEPDGFNVDLFKALMEELGYSYDLKLGNWEQIIADIQEKKIDVVIGMIYSQDRASFVRFTLPTCIINRNFITRKEDGYHSFEDLKGKEVVVEKGGWFHQYLLDNDFGVKIIESENNEESFKMLADGKYDAVLANELVANYIIKKHNFKNLKVETMDITPQNYSIVVNQDRDDLLYQINLGLQRLKSSGVYDQIYNKWFGIYESQKNRKTLLIALGVFLFIATWLVAFVLLLRNRVKRATRMLNYSKQEVEIAIDAGNISAWAYIIKDRTINTLHGKPFGFTEGSIDKVYERIHPEDVEKVRGEFDALSTGKKQLTDISFRIRDDIEAPYRYVETKMVRVEATKELPCRIVGTLKDVTTDVLMKQRLEDYRMKTQFIIKTNGINLVEYDIENHLFTRINDTGFGKSVQYTVEEYFKLVHPEDLPVVISFIKRMDKAEKSKFESEYRFQMEENDSYTWYSITAVAYKYDPHGNIISYIGLRRDNTKWKAINDDLILLKEKADASNHLKSAFLANISHEIRTPLNAIVGFSELIIDTEDHEEREKFLDIIRNNNALLLQLINDVLDLSSIEAGQSTLNYTTFDFADYFQGLCDSLRIKETDKVKLILKNKYEHREVCSDQIRITQVFMNLVANAFKFTHEGTITLDYTIENDGIKISVADTGIGISQNDSARVFERFEKVDTFAQGTGLGLSICREIAQALHGSIGFKSDLGKGSTFWFWFPCNRDANPPLK